MRSINYRYVARLAANLFRAVALLLACPFSALGHDPSAPIVQPAPPAETLLRFRPINGLPGDYDPLIASIGGAQIVALGEATHGTHEFYRERTRITERLVRDSNFRAIVIEGNWPDAERINRYVRGLGSDSTAAEALTDFREFPRWMWRNAEFADLVERVRTHNLQMPPDQRVGIYGMDIYNLFGAADAVVRYLSRVHPTAARRAQAHYRCFRGYRPDPAAYGGATRRPSRSCAVHARAVLSEIQQLPVPTDHTTREEQFSALLSAASVSGAEEYFRTNATGSYSWNVRDRWMASRVQTIADHVGNGGPGKVVVWAHNSHVGDARATDATMRGEINLGQLLRQGGGASAYLVGFLTHRGKVLAAHEWGGSGRSRALKPALPGSYGDLFHSAGVKRGYATLKGTVLRVGQRLQRAVGVLYRPETERESHYFSADLASQFDAAIYIDETSAVQPL